MTTIKIRSALFKRASAIARRHSDPFKRVINRALELGLDKLLEEYQAFRMPKNGSENGKAHTKRTPLSTEHFAWPSSLCDVDKSFVRENAHQFNNQQIADALQVSFQDAKAAREAYASEFIREHWLQMNDGDMGAQLHLFSCGVRKIRQRLGLNRHKNANRTVATLRSRLNPAELRKAITEDGMMLTEFAQRKGITCSRERLRQIANELGVSTAGSQRTVQWFASRWGVPHFGDKAVFERELEEAGSYFALAGKYGEANLSAHKVSALRDKHGIPAQRRFTTVSLVCDNPECGKTFHRDSFFVGREQSNGKKAEHVFCCRKCFCAYFSGKERVVAGMRHR